MQRPDLLARPNPDIDRKKLREEISERYAKTLAFLGRMTER